MGRKPAYKTKGDQRRLRLIKLIHVARRELGMADESYRTMLANMPALGGRTSSADLSIDGLELVLDQLKAKGFKVRPKSKKKAPDLPLADDRQSRRIRQLWLSLHEQGAVRDPSERALASFVQRMVGVSALQWLSTDQASQVIENLKKWRHRAIAIDDGGAK